MSAAEATEPTTRQQDREKAAEAALEREQEGAEVPAEVDPHEDRTKEMRTPGFARMRVDWHASDAPMMASIAKHAEDRIFTDFVDAYQVIHDIFEVVRVPKTNDEGEIVVDRHGYTVWDTAESGRYIEDYSLLGIKERSNFLHQITVRLFEWEQRAANYWGEAMFSKAQWEERFAIEFLDTEGAVRKTDEGLTQKARKGSRDERYFAIYQSLCSRKADALVRSLERIGQRLKDSL